MRPLFRLLAFVRPYWRSTAGAYLCVVGTAGATLVVPAMLGIAVDRGIGQREPNVLVTMGVAILVASALRGMLAFGQGYLGELSAQGTSYLLRKALYSHLQHLSFSFHDGAQTGELMARATSDVEAVRQFTGRGLVQIASLALLLVGVTIALLGMDWALALLSLAVLPLLVWRAERFGRRMRPLYRAVQNEVAALATLVQENVSGVRVVKAFGREAQEIDRFTAQNERFFQRSMEAAREAALNPPLLTFLSNVSILLMLWLGGVLVMAGYLTFGQLVAFYAYLLQLVLPIRRGGWLMAAASRAGASAERIFEILDTPVVVRDGPGAIALPRLLGRVEFQDVSCAYYPGRPVLEQVSFGVEPGQTIVLVGSTGSGKTSIANLIPRFYDVSAGRVLVDGYDVRTVKLESLRGQIGVVFQETLLFSGTVRENIAFGHPSASEDEVRAAARAANADEFIARLPRGYDTTVGERGVSLSGGQKQRIAIARALLLDPRILALDEFTSSVDVETEQLIRAALRALMRDRTTIIIAQRLSTARAADRILVMDRGRLVAQGTHEHLLRTSGEYRAICAAQFHGEEASGTPAAEQHASIRLAEGMWG